MGGGKSRSKGGKAIGEGSGVGKAVGEGSGVGKAIGEGREG